MNKPVSKTEALEVLRTIADFAHKAVGAFEDLRSSCGVLKIEIAITDNPNDPLSEEQMQLFAAVLTEWERTYNTLYKEADNL